MGREKMESSEEDLFDKYGLGLNARGKPDENADSTMQELLKPPRNELFDLIDRMATERMKEEPKRNDMYDKHKPIKGKFGFRRDETGIGPIHYTDLDDVLSFGDLDKDIDYQKYLVQQKRGRYDSQGNFISGMYDSNGNFIPGMYDAKGNFIPGRFDAKGNFIPGIYDDKGNFIPGKYDATTRRFIRGKFDSKGNVIVEKFKDGDDTDDDVLDGKRKSHKKGKKKKGDTDSESLPTSCKREKSLADMSEAMRQKYLENLRKAKRHPAVDFPMCNYPKWVHRMYRMDQVKIGQLTKQGMDVPEYTPPWMLDTLDRVWGNKDPKSRGEKPSNDPKLGKSRFQESDLSKKGGAKGRAVTSGRDSGLGKKGSQKETRGRGGSHGGTGGMDGKGGMGSKGVIDGKNSNDGKRALGGQAGEEGAKRDRYGTDNGLAGSLSGLADFLQGYEKEMVNLARLEDGDMETRKKKGDTSFDMNDLLDQYYNEVLREEKIHNHDRERFHETSLMEEKARKIKDRQEAALKRIHDKEKKIKQEEEIKKREEAEKIFMQKEKREKLLRRKEQQFGSGDHNHSKGHSKGKGKKGKGRDFTDKKTVETDPCAEFITSNQAKTTDDECTKRFRILLGGKKSRFLGGTDFLQLAKQIELFKYPPAPPKKTPCERVELPMCG